MTLCRASNMFAIRDLRSHEQICSDKSVRYFGIGKATTAAATREPLMWFGIQSRYNTTYKGKRVTHMVVLSAWKASAATIKAGKAAGKASSC